LDRAKSRFLRLSSHQLRGNVAAIHSMLGAIQTVGPLDERQADLARRIRQRAGELVVQMDEMLLLSTIRENGVEIQKRFPVDLAGVLRSVAEAASGEAIIQGLILTVEGCSDPVHVQAWSGAMETVFSNLLSNAVKYTPRGGQVSLSLRRRQQRAQVEMADTGIGIPDSMHEQVFQEFYRAPQARQITGGTGLGLPIVRAILDKLGGQIRLRGGEGPGAVVTVELPLVEPAASNEQGPAPACVAEKDKLIPVEKTKQTAST